MRFKENKKNMSKFHYPIESEEALKPFVLEMPSSIYIVGKRKTA